MAGSFIVVNLFGSSVLIRVAEAEVGVARLLAGAGRSHRGPIPPFSR